MKSLATALLATITVLALVACAPAAATSSAPTEAVIEPTEVQPTETPATEVSASEAPAATEAPVPAGAGKTFVIDPTQSVARFYIDETLMGAPNTVIGVNSNGVEGSITTDYANPAATTMSVVKVDMSSLMTDSNFRNGRIHGEILGTNDPTNRYAEFTMTSLSDLPQTVTVGQPFTFKITGTLAMHGVSKEVTFDVEVTPVSETQLNGKASLVVNYADWGVQILRLPPQVASVADTTKLEIEFVAVAK